MMAHGRGYETAVGAYLQANLEARKPIRLQASLYGFPASLRKKRLVGVEGPSKLLTLGYRLWEIWPHPAPSNADKESIG